MIRLLKYFLALVFIGSGLMALSQNQTKKWYFGQYAGLDFSTNPPTPLSNCAMSTWEGCSSVSDASGNLLFYTNGVDVWNQAHVIMANGSGLFGDNSSTQSALIVKQPGTTTIYFIFSSDPNSGLNYSVVDMSLAAGMGSVTTKNSSLSLSTTERLCGTTHCNGNDIWVISHDNYSDVFRATLVTSVGVSNTAVLSSVGTNFGGTNKIGSLKVSPNGKKIGTSFYNPFAFELYDFDPSTGTVSNPLTLTVTASGYGCEFSPDGTKFYGSLWATSTASFELVQWDICSGSDAAIQASSHSINATQAGQLQLGADGKIYMARAQLRKIKLSPEITIETVIGQSMIGVIHNPNSNSVTLNFNNTGQLVSPGLSLFGLPNIVSGFYKTPVAQYSYSLNPSISCVRVFFNAPPLIKNTCSATSYTVASVKWFFDDPASGLANSSTLLNPSHDYPALGNYNAKLVLYTACGGVIDTLKKIVAVGASLVNTPSAYSVCAGESLTLAASGSNTYSWSTGANSSSIVVNPNVNTTYTVMNIDQYGCLHRSVQTVTVYAVPNVSVAGIFTLCAGRIATLTASGALSYSWNTGATNSAINSTPAVSTSYTVTGTTYDGCSQTKVVTVTINEAPVPVIVGNTLVCAGSVATVTALGNNNYTWNNGEIGPTFTVVGSRDLFIFSVTAHYPNGCTRFAKVRFTVIPLPVLNLFGLDTVCAGSALTLSVSGAVSYTWNSSTKNNPATFYPLSNTTYTLSGSDTNHCVDTEVVPIVVRPSATLSANSSKVCRDQVSRLDLNSPIVPNATYIWKPGDIPGDHIVVTASATTLYTVTSNLDGCKSSATSTLEVLPTPSLVVSKDIEIVPGSSTQLFVSGSDSVTWKPVDFLSCSDCINPICTPVESIQYCVSSAIGQCSAVACVSVTVSCNSGHDLSVPNAFTPNDDKQNDSFCLQGWEECISNFAVIIFDRWGEKVFESNDPSFCWDGYYRGQLLNSGVYVYVINAKKHGEKSGFTKKGNINLIK